MIFQNKICTQIYHSPCGELILASIGDELCLFDWNEKPCAERNKQRLIRLLKADFEEKESETICQATSQLDEYFAGKRKEFDLKLRLVGTDFQKSVWRALMEIPYGETRSYMQIAERIGNPKGVRAVAQAIGANGLAIIVPCHRVIGANHSLTGFAGGLEAKRFLLNLEGKFKK